MRTAADNFQERRRFAKGLGLFEGFQGDLGYLAAGRRFELVPKTIVVRRGAVIEGLWPGRVCGECPIIESCGTK